MNKIFSVMNWKLKLLTFFCILFTVLTVFATLLFPNLIAQLIGLTASKNIEQGLDIQNREIHLTFIGFIKLGPYKDIYEATRKMIPLFLGILFLGFLFNVISSILANYVSVKTSLLLRQQLFEHIQGLNQSQLNKLSSSRLLINLTNDIEKIEQGLFLSLKALLLGPLYFIGGLVFALLTNLKLSISFAVLIPLLVITLAIVAWKGLPLFKKQQDVTDSINMNTKESIAGIKLIKSYNCQNFIAKRYERVSRKWAQIGIKGLLIQYLGQISVVLMINLATVTILAVSASPLMRPDLSNLSQEAIKIAQSEYQNFIVSINSFIGYLWTVTTGFIMTIFILVFCFRSHVSAKRYYEVIAHKNTLLTNPNNEKNIEKGDIEFNNVSFRYYESSIEPVLKNVSFKIKSGETIGIIGPTGSGKTSLAKLITHEYDAQEGKIFIDGQLIQEYNQTNLNKAITHIYQKPFLFSGSIEKNMRLANSDATEQEIYEALKISCIDDFVKEQDTQLNYEISQGSTNVSGGQRQRLFIAQGLLKKPKILILDDSTSALDNKTEKKVKQSIIQKYKNLTTFIISQKITSVKDCDKIIVLENGVITGFDTHNNLLKNHALYKEINVLQGGGNE
ncbi:ABC transporter ATP-binding protein [Mycoplasma phocoenae]|uniref:ABC transporter ATP-binding protein n=1 Tax=Mycoplasma phocoenae TaxID=754517 RepID=A0A858U2V9_9MOLU|nr:ABC transporter ATP-binding protein [Mycoplasma phocoenae]QJG66752.1 ABC transporter ATP-binding protein [Mycoplasma phocoenae]